MHVGDGDTEMRSGRHTGSPLSKSAHKLVHTAAGHTVHARPHDFTVHTRVHESTVPTWLHAFRVHTRMHKCRVHTWLHAGIDHAPAHMHAHAHPLLKVVEWEGKQLAHAVHTQVGATLCEQRFQSRLADDALGASSRGRGGGGGGTAARCRRRGRVRVRRREGVAPCSPPHRLSFSKSPPPT
eukprot:366177-Chlamydomonas_euryale.AAC.6